MKIIPTPFEGLFVIETRIFEDERGFFTETYNEKLFAENGLLTNWKQDNWSHSQRGVLRGLHFQKAPYAQSKSVRVLRGSVFDVVVDIRPDSKTYKRWFGIELSAQNKKSLYIPEGFAHGFATLEDNTSFTYKCSEFYNPSSEAGFMWNDPAFNIEWPLAQHEIKLSPKDLKYDSFK